MLTPSFDITQDDQYVILTLRVPYVKVRKYSTVCPASASGYWLRSPPTHCRPQMQNFTWTAPSSSSIASRTSSGTVTSVAMLSSYSPWWCRLHLPGKVTEDGRERAVFDIDKGVYINTHSPFSRLSLLPPGIMTVHIPKLQSGEHFYNLGMLTALLSRKPLTPTSSQKPLIEVLGEEEEEEGGRGRQHMAWHARDSVCDMLETVCVGRGGEECTQNVYS